MAIAPKRQLPKYVSYQHEGVAYVVDVNNREVLRDWVAIERQAMPEIVAACLRETDQAVAC